MITLSWNAVTGATGYEIHRWDTHETSMVGCQSTSTPDGAEENPDTRISRLARPLHTKPSLMRPIDGNVTDYFVIRTISSGDVRSNWSAALTGIDQEC